MLHRDTDVYLDAAMTGSSGTTQKDHFRVGGLRPQEGRAGVLACLDRALRRGSATAVLPWVTLALRLAINNRYPYPNIYDALDDFSILQRAKLYGFFITLDLETTGNAEVHNTNGDHTTNHFYHGPFKYTAVVSILYFL